MDDTQGQQEQKSQKQNKGGRPKSATPKDIKTSVMLDALTYEALETIRTRLNLDRSAYIRNAVRDAIERDMKWVR